MFSRLGLVFLLGFLVVFWDDGSGCFHWFCCICYWCCVDDFDFAIGCIRSSSRFLKRIHSLLNHSDHTFFRLVAVIFSNSVVYFLVAI